MTFPNPTTTACNLTKDEVSKMTKSEAIQEAVSTIHRVSRINKSACPVLKADLEMLVRRLNWFLRFHFEIMTDDLVAHSSK